MQWTPLGDEHIKQLSQNLQALETYRPSLHEVLQSLPERISKIEIIQDQGLIFGARVINQNAYELLPVSPDTLNRILQQAQSIDQAVENKARYIVLSGIGIGHVINAALNHAENNRVGFAFVEPDLYAWAVALCAYPLSEAFVNSNLQFFAGEQAQESFIHFASHHHAYMLGPDKIKYLLGSLNPKPEVTQPYIVQAKSIAEALNNNFEHFDHSFLDFIKKTQLPLSSKPKSAWCTAHQNAYIHYPIAQALLEGLSENGLKTTLEPFDTQALSPCRITGNHIEQCPELTLSVNSFPSLVLEDLGIARDKILAHQWPKVCWMVDNTSLYEDDYDRELIQNDIIICNERAFLPWLKTLSNRVHFMLVATTLQASGQYREELAAPISYIGSLPDLHQSFHALPDECNEILEQLEQLKSTHPEKSFHELYQSLSPNSKQHAELLYQARAFTATTQKKLEKEQTILEYYFYNAATFIKRWRIIEALLPLGIHIYGPASWEHQLPLRYKNRYKGFLQRQHLADVYASSQININLHSHQCPTCLNTRDFDVPMAGGFLLSDWVADMDKGYLSEGEHFTAFESSIEDAAEKLTEKVENLLNDEDTRARIKKQGQAHVKQHHTFKHRMKDLLDLLQ